MKKNTKTKKNKKGLIILVIVAAVLIVGGISASYLLKNNGLPGGEFNAMINTSVKDGGGTSGACYCCGNSQGYSYTWAIKNPNTGSCAKVNKTKAQCKGTTTIKYKVTLKVKNGSGAKSITVIKGNKATFTLKPKNGYVGNFLSCTYNNSSKYADFDIYDYQGGEKLIVPNVQGNITCFREYKTKKCVESGAVNCN